MSPSIKASIVSLLQRSSPRNVVCAIGNGGNDVAMLQSSNVGVGIADREGGAAARAADVTAARFI